MKMEDYEFEESPGPSSGKSSKNDDLLENECPICLNIIMDKSSTDNCNHNFCFNCLVEWAEIRPVCPLCRKTFDIIIHNTTQNIRQENASLLRRVIHRFLNDITFDNFTSEQIEDIQYLKDYVNHRIQFASHLTENSRYLISNSFRKSIYLEDIWAYEQNSFRNISSDFFLRNPASTDRLFSFLSREVLAVLSTQQSSEGASEADVSIYVEFILILITCFEIRSEDFKFHIDHIFKDNTEHFVYEFYNFAVSSYETIYSYDEHVQYVSGNFDMVYSDADDDDAISFPVISSSIQNIFSESSIINEQINPRENLPRRETILRKLFFKERRSSISNSVSFEFAGPSTSHGLPLLNISPINTDAEVDISSDEY